jgi:hypothetical protein
MTSARSWPIVVASLEGAERIAAARVVVATPTVLGSRSGPCAVVDGARVVAIGCTGEGSDVACSPSSDRATAKTTAATHNTATTIAPTTLRRDTGIRGRLLPAFVLFRTFTSDASHRWIGGLTLL